MQVPIIAPIRHKKVEVLEKEALKTKYSTEFLKGMMGNPDLIRNIAVVGHLHHGKTLVRSFCPLLMLTAVENAVASPAHALSIPVKAAVMRCIVLFYLALDSFL